jgi:hypothetical protein
MAFYADMLIAILKCFITQRNTKPNSANTKWMSTANVESTEFIVVLLIPKMSFGNRRLSQLYRNWRDMFVGSVVRV